MQTLAHRRDEMMITRENIDVLCGYYSMPMDCPGEFVTAWHVTRRDNVESISRNGLKANECVAQTFSGPRPAAVYLFACQSDAADANVQAVLFGDDADVEILKVRIPAESFANIADDGLFNASCSLEDGGYPWAFRHLADIPAEWISVE